MLRTKQEEQKQGKKRELTSSHPPPRTKKNMGAWGYYSDQSDAVMDLWEDVIESVMRKKKATSSIKSTRKFFVQHPLQVYASVLHCVEKEITDDEREDVFTVALGILLMVARFFTSSKDVQEELLSGFPARIMRIQQQQTETLPTHLPKHYPKSLRELALSLCKISRSKVDMFKDENKRIEAIYEEQNLFAFFLFRPNSTE